MSGGAPRSQRFTRSSRLTHRREFAAVYAGKARIERGPIIVHGIPNDCGQARLGLAIGRRVGSAVRRVRLKRMLREAFRISRARLAGHYDLIVSAKAHEDAGLAAYQALLVDAVTELDRLWTKRLGRIRAATAATTRTTPPASDDRRSPPGR